MRNVRLAATYCRAVLLRTRRSCITGCFIQNCQCSSDSRCNRLKVSAVVVKIYRLVIGKVYSMTHDLMTLTKLKDDSIVIGLGVGL